MKKTLVFLSFLLGFWAIAQDTYELAPESALFIHGTSTAHDWTVKAQKMQGSLLLDAETIKEIAFEVQVADIQSERGGAMDKKMHAALKKEAYPKVQFLCKEVQKDDLVLIGRLRIAGVDQEVELDADRTFDKGTVHFKGEKELVLQDFDMKPPSAMFGQIVVGDTIQVQFDLVFTKK